MREKVEELGLVKEQHSDEVSRLMGDMRTLRLNYEDKIKEYEALLDLRVKLEQEIQTLSALLQEEENRWAGHGVGEGLVRKERGGRERGGGVTGGSLLV